jgi:hypothetical protein
MISRALLTKAFPNNPRIVAELEAVDSLIDQLQATADELQTHLSSVEQALNAGNYQQASVLLSAISGLRGKIGAIEVTSEGQAAIRPIDSADPASLLTRGTAYTVLTGIAGKGTTVQRPTLPTNAVAIYFDTTLNAGGKPIFWNGSGWVDNTGASV